MFQSMIIIRELNYPCQSYYYSNNVVCMLSLVVWQHISNKVIYYLCYYAKNIKI